jgi:hypothetical protein
VSSNRSHFEPIEFNHLTDKHKDQFDTLVYFIAIYFKYLILLILIIILIKKLKKIN